MKQTGLIIIAVLFLTGCAGTFVAGAVSGGLAVYDRRSIATIHNDESTRHKISLAILRDKAFKTSNISVSSFNRVVLLAGQTPYASLRVEAEKIALKMKGVKKVYNEIEIGEKISTSQHIADSWITTKVRTALITTSKVKSGHLKVITDNGVVYLMGDVSQKQEDLAVDVARRVSNVRKVVKVFDENDDEVIESADNTTTNTNPQKISEPKRFKPVNTKTVKPAVQTTHKRQALI